MGFVISNTSGGSAIYVCDASRPSSEIRKQRVFLPHCLIGSVEFTSELKEFATISPLEESSPRRDGPICRVCGEVTRLTYPVPALTCDSGSRVPTPNPRWTLRPASPARSVSTRHSSRFHAKPDLTERGNTPRFRRLPTHGKTQGLYGEPMNFRRAARTTRASRCSYLVLVRQALPLRFES